MAGAVTIGNHFLLGLSQKCNVLILKNSDECIFVAVDAADSG
jgi:hypothetical protein